jgi:pyruvate dehydrogenase E1 component alpha subunit
MDQWLDRCPIKKFRNQLIQEKILTEGMDKKIETNVRTLIEEAFQFAKESPYPLPEEATRDVFY